MSDVCRDLCRFAGSTEKGTSDKTWGATDQATCNATVLAALDAGVTFFDTAEAYGADRQAERALGAALASCGRRNEVVIATKFGTHAPLWTTDDPTGAARLYDGAAVEGALAASLAALATDRVELFQIHWPANVGIVGDAAACKAAGTWDNVLGAVAALERARAAKLARYWGVCNFGVDDAEALDAALAELGSAYAPVTNQVPYNLLWRQIERGILGDCVRRGTAVLCYSPLQQGLLGGRVAAATDVAEGRKRTRFYASDASDLSRHGGPGVEATLFGADGALARLKKSADDAGVSLAALSVAWLARQTGVACVLVGASTPEQARRNAAEPAALDAAALKAVDAATAPLQAALAAAYGTNADQYAAESRIHGNGDP